MITIPVPGILALIYGGIIFDIFLGKVSPTVS